MKDEKIFMASTPLIPGHFKCTQFLHDVHAITGIRACTTASHTPQAHRAAINDLPIENDQI